MIKLPPGDVIDNWPSRLNPGVWNAVVEVKLQPDASFEPLGVNQQMSKRLNAGTATALMGRSVEKKLIQSKRVKWKTRQHQAANDAV